MIVYTTDLYTAGISQYNPIQLAILQDLIGQIFASELDYIVKCPQCILDHVVCL